MDKGTRATAPQKGVEPLAHSWPRRSRAAWLFRIAFVALILRLVCLVYLTKAINLEGAEYARIAENLLAGKGYVGIATEGRELIFPPFYPVLIAAGSFVTGDFFRAAQLVSLIAGVLLLFPLFGIARDLYGDQVARIAASMAALHPVLIMLSATTWVEGPYLTLLTISVYHVNRTQCSSNIRHWLLGGTFLGLAYLTCPQAILFPPAFLILLLALHYSRRLVTFRNATMFLGSFIIVASPYVIFLSVSTGQFRLEGKTIFNSEQGRRVLSGQPWELAAHEVTPELEERGVSMQPTAELGKSPGSANYLTTLAIVSSFGVQNFLQICRDFIVRPYSGAPFLLPLAVFGFLRSTWTRRRVAGECILFLAVLGALLPLLTIPFVATRHKFVVLPFMVIWACLGINELRQWIQCAITKFRVPRISPRSGGAAAAGLAFLSLLVCSSSTLFTGFWGSDIGPESAATRSAGEWLARLPGDKTVMDTFSTVAFHAGGGFVPMPYCDSRTALKYAEKKGVNFIIVRNWWVVDRRPYLQEWLTSGIPSPNATLVHTAGFESTYRILIFALNRTDPRDRNVDENNRGPRQ
jgi:4-amino-4-deoxy-L-arabinose transferase-like glycosyltransferase